jgi:ferric-dicitrate binding protein FerR (iron transport regulator)
MDQQIELIGKKLSGSLNEAEEVLFRKSMKDANFKVLYKKYQRIWIGSRDDYSVMNTHSVLKKVLTEIQKEEEPGNFLEKQNSKLPKRNWALKIAASFLIVSSLAFTTYWYMSSSDSDSDIALQSVQILKQNPRGQKSTVFLPDGSIVVLNSESSISYPSVFTEQFREVVLIGEAFFEIEPNPELPFIVKTKAMDIRVLGTSFNVNADTTKMTHKISLVNGEVEVTQKILNTAANDKVILFPGQAIAYDIGEKAFGDIITFNPKAAYGWKNGLIYFEKASFEEVLQKLKRWYGVEFVIDGMPDNEWHYSGEFDNYALNNVLHALSFTGRFNYEIEGKKVLVKF